MLLLLLPVLMQEALSAPAQEAASAPVQDVELSLFHVKTTIGFRYSRTEVTALYRNPGVQANKAVFTMVLPESAFISNFSMTIKEEEYVAEVKEKEEASRFPRLQLQLCILCICSSGTSSTSICRSSLFSSRLFSLPSQLNSKLCSSNSFLQVWFGTTLSLSAQCSDRSL